MNKVARFQPYKARPYSSTKDVVTRLIDEAGGAKMAAHLLGCSPTQTVAYSDPATPEEMKLDQVRRLVSASGATAPAEDLAFLAGGIFLPMGSSEDCFASLAAHSASEYGEFATLVMQAMADGKIGKLEKQDVLRELDDLIRCLVHARAKLVSEQGERE